MKRRNFLTNLGATTLGLAFLQDVKANGLNSAAMNFLQNAGAVGRVVVVGGGMAGTTIAKYLRLWGGAGMDVTLVEPNATYYSNIFSNMVLTGERSLSQLAFTYANLKSKYGVKVMNYSVTGLNPGSKSVTLSNGTVLGYDRLVLAPGIDFIPIPMSGSTMNREKIMHAWKAGTQTTTLKSQIQGMTNKDTFILTIPKSPYRCPPGPYERACVVADYLKNAKGGGKVVVLDANDKIQAEPVNFGNAFNVTHKSIVTYVPNAVISNIDADTSTVVTNLGSFKGKVINAIPSHKAGNIISMSGLGLNNSADARWAVVDVLTYESTAIPFVHIIGDSSSTTQPKAGHIANAEAKVCADAIIKMFQGLQVNQSPITNSSCFTPITKTTASFLTVVFRYDPATRKMMPTGAGVVESNGYNSHHYEDMLKWFNNLMSDTFS